MRTYCVRIMNLTLSVDEQIVERARTTAAAMGLSLNQAVRDYLSELAGQSAPEADMAEIEHLSLVAGGSRRGWQFNRGELHDRRSMTCLPPSTWRGSIPCRSGTR